jgi:hypothetical protein
MLAQCQKFSLKSFHFKHHIYLVKGRLQQANEHKSTYLERQNIYRQFTESFAIALVRVTYRIFTCIARFSTFWLLKNENGVILDSLLNTLGLNK